MDLDEIKRGLRAEIKKRENEQYFTFQCNVRQMCKDVLAKLEEMEAENAELKQKLEDAQASAYAESVDAGMENRRLKRALWLARAERAKERKYKYETWERNETKKFNRDGDLIALVSIKARKWRRVEIKCVKKAEEYK